MNRVKGHVKNQQHVTPPGDKDRHLAKTGVGGVTLAEQNRSIQENEPTAILHH